uniref:Uncharacterized protein n=1 Tax=Glossina palpalis gambiensis TaxID=67801 RepID=A0A1B0BT92_9MUSC
MQLHMHMKNADRTAKKVEYNELSCESCCPGNVVNNGSTTVMTMMIFVMVMAMVSFHPQFIQASSMLSLASIQLTSANRQHGLLLTQCISHGIVCLGAVDTMKLCLVFKPGNNS